MHLPDLHIAVGKRRDSVFGKAKNGKRGGCAETARWVDCRMVSARLESQPSKRRSEEEVRHILLQKTGGIQ